MKNYLSIFLILSIGTFLFSCQDKDEDCIYLDKRRCDPNFVLPEIAEGIVELKSPIINYDEKVLLEDFTGFRCTNCLPATVTAANLKAANPNRLSIAAVHVMFEFSTPGSDPTKPFYKDFRTTEGPVFESYYGLTSLPRGAINRIGGDFLYAEWTDLVNVALADNNPEVYISIENLTVDEENQQIVADVYAKPLIPSSEKYLINISVTESGIAEAQMNSASPGGIITDYVHNHVYRGSGYGAWGIDVFQGDIDLRTNEVLAYKLTMDVKPEWDLSNCEVLVFISKSSNREVVQIEEAPLL